jgi:hypothetical protein
MDKKIIVNVKRGNDDDVVTYVDEQGQTCVNYGLVKQIPPEYHSRTVRDVVSYVCRPDADSYNKALSESEQNLSQTYLGKVQEKTISFVPLIGTQYDQSYKISLDDVLESHFGRIINKRDITTGGDCETVGYISLQMFDVIDGGMSLEHKVKSATNYASNLAGKYEP